MAATAQAALATPEWFSSENEDWVAKVIEALANATQYNDDNDLQQKIIKGIYDHYQDDGVVGDACEELHQFVNHRATLLINTFFDSMPVEGIKRLLELPGPKEAAKKEVQDGKIDLGEMLRYYKGRPVWLPYDNKNEANNFENDVLRAVLSDSQDMMRARVVHCIAHFQEYNGITADCPEATAILELCMHFQTYLLSYLKQKSMEFFVTLINRSDQFMPVSKKKRKRDE